MKTPTKQGGEVIEEEHPQQRYKLLCNRCCKLSNHYSNKTFISSIIRLDAIVTAKGENKQKLLDQKTEEGEMIGEIFNICWNSTDIVRHRTVRMVAVEQGKYEHPETK